VGADPHWLPGLDLLRELGLDAVVIPHFDNGEGGNHDTRFCYLGERRLSMMEQQLPASTFIVGVDEHTSCVFDLDARTAEVEGRGVVTIRRAGRWATITAGSRVALDTLPVMAEQAAHRAPTTLHTGDAVPAPPEPAPGSPLLEAVAGLEQAFEGALARRDGQGAVRSILDMEQTLRDWSRDTLQSDEMDRARTTLRSMIVRLGEAARSGLHDPRETVAPFVDALLAIRDRARAEKRWADADHIRDHLVEAGIEVHDRPEGTAWSVGALVT
jgi:hypothetical protein